MNWLAFIGSWDGVYIQISIAYFHTPYTYLYNL